MRTDRYKLIHFYRIDEWELYDLQNDPDEMTSVYGDPAYAAITDELKVELDRLQDQYEVTDEADLEYDRMTAPKDKKNKK